MRNSRKLLFEAFKNSLVNLVLIGYLLKLFLGFFYLFDVLSLDVHDDLQFESKILDILDVDLMSCHSVYLANVAF